MRSAISFGRCRALRQDHSTDRVVRPASRPFKMMGSTVHIVFSDSAAGLLRRALRSAERAEQVLSFPGNLSFGPINPPDCQIRIEWMRQHLGCSSRDWDWLPAATSEFWSSALSASEPLTVWTSRRTTLEYSGFLEWVCRCDDRPYNVVDLTDVVAEWRQPDGTSGQELVVSLALLNPDRVQILSFLDRAAPLPAVARDEYRQMWEQLRVENAPLRIIRGARLQSAPITAFDELLLSCADERWVKTARVIGRALAESWDGDGIQVDDLVLGARVPALVAAGRLDGRGDLSDWRHSEVRLSPARGEAASSVRG